jgi:hypothetical protein
MKMDDSAGVLRERCEELENKVGQAYQVIGNILHITGIFSHSEGQRALDYFSSEEYDDDFRWPSVNIVFPLANEETK